MASKKKEFESLMNYISPTKDRNPQGSNLLSEYLPKKQTSVNSGAPASVLGAAAGASASAAPSASSVPKTGTSVPSYETDFQKWYGKNYGTSYKGDALSQGDLSDGEFDVGQTLHKYYLQDQMATQQKDAALKKLAAERSTAEQSASITHDLMQKYLPQQLRAQGLGNLGVSDSAMLEANNNYLSTMAGLAGDFSERALTLEEAYGQGKLERELAKADEVKGVLDAYRTKAETEAQKAEEEAKAAQEAEFVNLDTIITEGYYNTPSELRAYLDAHKGGLSDTQYRLLDQMVNYLENSPEEAEQAEAREKQAAIEEASGLKTLPQTEVKQKADAEAVATMGAGVGALAGALINPILGIGTGIASAIYEGKNDRFEKGDNFNVKIGDLTYKVQSGGESTDANVLSAAKSVENNSVFAYDEKLYLKRSGKVYIVEARDLTKRDHYDKLWAQFYS